jgi:hypothetical protein
MEKIVPWLPEIFSGIIGVLITIFFNFWRNRIPKIKVNRKTEVLYENKVSFGENEVYLVLDKNANDPKKNYYAFDNAYIYNLRLMNSSNKSFSKFNFSVTFPKHLSPIMVKASGADKLHVIRQLNVVNPNDDNNDIDFILEPFNRKDVYHILILYTVKPNDDEKTEKNDVPRIITNEDAKFVYPEENMMLALRILLETLSLSKGITISKK